MYRCDHDIYDLSNQRDNWYKLKLSLHFITLRKSGGKKLK